MSEAICKGGFELGSACGKCVKCFDQMRIKVAGQAQEIERLDSERAEQWRMRRDIEAQNDTNKAVIDELLDQLSQLKSRQPGVVLPERMIFSYRHKDGSQAAVTVNRSEVLDKMGDHIYEELIGKFCQCQSVGETNVVECNCEDYATGFQLVDDEVSRLNSSAVSAGRANEPNCAAIRDAGNNLYNELRQWLATEHDSDSQDAMESWRAALAATAPSHSEQGEAVAYINQQQLKALRQDCSATCSVWNESGRNRIPLYTAPPSIPETGVVIKRELRPVLAMILNALDRDAAEGKSARGEMADELRAILSSKGDV